jgi:hypothetical protein
VGLVVELALSEMFGTVAEEKEVMKITAKLAEAKGTKSYDSLQILAKYDSVKFCMDAGSTFLTKRTAKIWADFCLKKLSQQIRHFFFYFFYLCIVKKVERKVKLTVYGTTLKFYLK